MYNTWKEIKSLISLKTVASSVLTVLSLGNGDTITNPYNTANTLNNYFASIAKTTKKKKKKRLDIHINIFQIIFQMKVVVQYFCSLQIKKKLQTSYSLLILIRLLAQVVYLIENYFLKWNFKAITKFIQPLFHDACFSFCTYLKLKR